MGTIARVLVEYPDAIQEIGRALQDIDRPDRKPVLMELLAQEERAHPTRIRRPRQRSHDPQEYQTAAQAFPDGFRAAHLASALDKRPNERAAREWMRGAKIRGEIIKISWGVYKVAAQ